MDMCRTTVDNSKNIWTDKITIADLAKFSFNECNSETMSIYTASDIIKKDWKWETSNVDMEHGTGITVTFKDGSVLNVAAWGC